MKRAVPVVPVVVLGLLLLSGCGADSIQELRGGPAGHGAHSAAGVAGAPVQVTTPSASDQGADSGPGQGSGQGADHGSDHSAHGAGAGLPTPSPAPPMGTAAGVAFNPPDVMFLQMMVPHNTQGVRLVRLVRERPVRPEVKELAEAIGVTQERESASMSGLLSAWGQPATAKEDEHTAHGGMPGVSDEEMAALIAAPPAEFERRFLDMLIAHQDDATQMAKVEVATGLHSKVTEMAKRVDVSRTAQIAQMLALRGQ
ncbi:MULTISPECIES: DUF305 domain-containing protein [unclassified Streptosporangium]|uniref:DUF305 domain-containing protein n=1 Tax=unclassified Streptosporangium TaxID=2632669 RepID=UPI002E2DFBA9|nr:MULTISPECIES: DUF305 domain-containing protein [unclassified Streptosporangium]